MLGVGGGCGWAGAMWADARGGRMLGVGGWVGARGGRAGGC